jgi:3-phenylpropionate/trans-cinnamate dioxygenase ferredoxin reductase subunit
MIAVVGGGAAGISAAEGLRECGYDGEIGVWSSEPVAPYDRPSLSKGFLLNGERGDPPPLRPARELARAAIGLALGDPVVEIDTDRRELVTAEGREASYEMLLLATGSEPRRLRVPGDDAAGIHYLREADDARALASALRMASRVAIVGGGVIGLEVAACAIQLGASVSVIELEPRLMDRLAPAELAEVLASHHRECGVTIRAGIRVVAFEHSQGQVRGVCLADGSVVSADVVVVGIGAAPRTDLAARAGLRVDDGIVVDEGLRSSDERVFAAGDVARVFHRRTGRHVRIEQWQPAQDQGRHAAAHMLGSNDPYLAVPWMWSDQGDVHLQATGFGFADVDVVCRGDLGAPGGFACFGVLADRLVAACGASIGTAIARTIRAAQILIDHDVRIDPNDLADPSFDLRRAARNTVRAPNRADATG